MAQVRLPWTAVRDWVLERPGPMVVITGGEPLLQQRHLSALVEAWSGAGWRVEVETNATVAPSPRLVQAVSAFNVSPKLAHSGVAHARRVRPSVLASFVDSGKAVFKFVVRGLADLDEVACLVSQHRLAPVWVMPEGTSSVEVLTVLRQVADEAIGRGWNLSTRLHTLLWEDARGR